MPTHEAPRARSRPTGRRFVDAGTLIGVWAVLLLLMPANLVVGPLGAAGSPAQLLGLAALVWWVAWQLTRSGSGGDRPEPLKIATLAFVIAIVASYVAAAVRPVEAVETSAADRSLLIVLAWVGIVVLATDGLNRRDRLDRVIRIVVFCAGIAGALGVLQFITHEAYVNLIEIPGLTRNGAVTSIYDRNGLARAAGTSTHPIEFGVVLAMTLPLALHLALTDTVRSRARRWWPVLAIAAATPITLSRSTILGLALSLAIVMPGWTRTQRRWAYGWLAVGLGVVYVSVPGLLGTLTKLFTGIAEDGSALSRVDSLDIALHYAAQYPVSGRGYGTFLPRYRILDNQYLGLLIETGVVGILAVLALFTTAIVVARQVRRVAGPGPEASLARALTATVAVAALACATFDAFGFPQVAGLLFFAIGAIGALYRSTRTNGRAPRKGIEEPLGPLATTGRT